MPSLEEEPITDLSSPDSSVLFMLPSLSTSEFSGSSESERDQLSPVISPIPKFEIPLDPSFREILIAATGSRDLTDVSEVTLQVISADVSLSHLSFLIPNLNELKLDGSYLLSLRDLGCGLKNLKVLHVARCGLTSLDGIFGLETLHELHAAHNKIEDPSPCSFLPHVRILDLKGNDIKNIDYVAFLANCSFLENLVLADNENLINLANYRQIIKNYLPNLKILDSVRFEGEVNSLGGCSQVEFTSSSSSASSHSNQHFLPAINQKFTVSFPPKVLSPRPLSDSSSTRSSSQSSSPKECIFPDIRKKTF